MSSLSEQVLKVDDFSDTVSLSRDLFFSSSFDSSCLVCNRAGSTGELYRWTGVAVSRYSAKCKVL